MQNGDMKLTNVRVQRLLMLVELQRHFGARDFRYTDIRKMNGMHASEQITTEMAVKSGWLEKLGNGRYRLTDKSLDLINYVRGVIV